MHRGEEGVAHQSPACASPLMVSVSPHGQRHGIALTPPPPVVWWRWSGDCQLISERYGLGVYYRDVCAIVTQKDIKLSLVVRYHKDTSVQLSFAYVVMPAVQLTRRVADIRRLLCLNLVFKSFFKCLFPSSLCPEVFLKRRVGWKRISADPHMCTVVAEFCKVPLFVYCRKKKCFFFFLGGRGSI